MSFGLLLLVPFFFSAIHFLEFTATMARLGGLRAKSHMLGYSIQHAVYVGTRLFMMMLLPTLGLVVDTRTDIESYQVMAISALIGAAAFSMAAYMMRGYIVGYYENVILKYQETGNFTASFLVSFKTGAEPVLSFAEMLRVVWANVEGRKVMVQSVVVFAIYSTGIFISFYAALSYFEYRASISQLSGIINAAGTVLLTFFVEPRISRGIDARRDDAETLVHALLIGRLVGVAFLGQALLIFVFVGI